MSSPSRKSDVPNPSISATPRCSNGCVDIDGLLQHYRANKSVVDYATAYERFSKRSRVIEEPKKEVFWTLSTGYVDLPTNLFMTLNQGSAVKSMDFHPLHLQQILLLVGTNTGDVMVWQLGNRERIALKNFKVWDLGACSVRLQMYASTICSEQEDILDEYPETLLYHEPKRYMLMFGCRGGLSEFSFQQ